MYNLARLNDLEVGPDDRPEEPLKILRADVLWNPFEDIVPRVDRCEGVVAIIAEELSAARAGCLRSRRWSTPLPSQPPQPDPLSDAGRQGGTRGTGGGRGRGRGEQEKDGAARGGKELQPHVVRRRGRGGGRGSGGSRAHDAPGLGPRCSGRRLAVQAGCPGSRPAEVRLQGLVGLGLGVGVGGGGAADTIALCRLWGPSITVGHPNKAVDKEGGAP